MNVLVIGSGGREHALVWKAAQSRLAGQLHCIPGNAGISALAACPRASADDFTFIEKYCVENKIDMIIVGPEVPLMKGAADHFLKKGYKVFGPGKAAARLEGSKAFAKNFMKNHGIPTAAFEVFDDPRAAGLFIRNPIFKNGTAAPGYPIVIKADGLAAGKGVVICHTSGEAAKALDSFMRKKTLGEAGSRIVIEECLQGQEASILCLTDGNTIVPMLPARDHKRAYDGDTGPNTGGMGCYAPEPLVTPKLSREIQKKILAPVLTGLKKERLDYRGVLYVGIMIVNGHPFVLEFNVRFGDPETQVLMPLLDTDLLELADKVCSGALRDIKIKWKKGACACVVMAAGGYPQKPESGKTISGLDRASELKNISVFHSGTALKDGRKIITSGGRVLGVTAAGKSQNEAVKKAYEAVAMISFEGAHWRKDIGKRGRYV